MINQLCIRLLIAGLLCTTLSTISLGQNQKAQEGMTVTSRNFQSFNAPVKSHLSEWEALTPKSTQSHPEFGILPKDAPCTNCVEDLTKRKVDERYFIDLDDPSKFYVQKALGDLHQLVNNNWVSIDHNLAQKSGGLYESRFAYESAGIQTNEQHSFIRTVHGSVQFNNWTLYTINGDETTFQGSMSWENYSIGEDGMYVTNAFPGIDAELIIFRGSIKTNFILKSNEFGTFDYLAFSDTFSGQEGLELNFAEHNGLRGTGTLQVHTQQHSLLEVSEAILFARNGPKDLMRTGEYLLEGNSMKVLVPFSWINANINDYELVIDPAVTGTATLAQASITGSRYNGSCTFANSCDYNLTVTSPANATLTNVAWTFTYTAAGSCWLEDGAIRISSGGCTSPASSGYYWFCNAIGGGNCSGNNQTIWNDVSSCMPAPSCTPVNVPFILRFYRSCWGSSGCSNTCIGAGSPWTMTITGQTIAYTNTASPITLSATSVCAGGSINASTTGQYGVPGYTYNWSFSPTGSPSVGTGSSTSITFPTAGTVTLYSFVTDACGNVVTATRTVTVTPGPTIAVNSATICEGQNAVLNATGATTYSWSPSATLSAGTGSSVTATPATTTTYTVSGTTGSCTGTATATVTVNPNPVISVNSEIICSGGSAVLNASGASSYSWSPATTLSAGTGSSVTATPTSTTTYTVTGTTGSCSNSASSTVTVNPNPVISVNNATICAGQNAALTASGATTYSWTPAATLSASTGTSVNATPATTTTYTVTGTIGSCTSTATSTVTVNPNPVIAVNSATICAGQNAVLNATGANTYTWTPSATLSSGTGNSVTATPATTTTYTVTGTTGSCTGTATSTVTVNPNPVVSVNSATICAGQNAALNATGANTYTWTPSATLSSGTGTSVTATPATTTTYTVTGTTGSCTGTATSTVTVNPNPVVTVNNSTICAGQNAVLNATGANTYSWTPSATLSSGTGNSVTATPAITTTYTVTGTIGTCTGTATSTVAVNPNPAVSVNSATVCSGQSANLNASGANTYAWSPSATLSSGSGASVTATPGTTTTYTVTGTNSTTGCSSTASSTVTVNPTPTVTASNNGPLCQGSTLDLTANSSAGATFNWSGPNGFTSTAQNPTVTSSADVANEGVYTVVATLGNCASTASTSFSLIPGISSAINSNGPYCANEGVVVLSAVNPGGTWSGTGIVNPATGAFDPSQANIGPNSITYSIPGSCGGPTTALVVVNPVPVVSFTNSSSTGCAPLTVQFTSTTSGVIAHNWNFGNGQTGTSTSESPQFVNSGCYNITLNATDANGCIGTYTANNLICVPADPIAQFHATSNEQSILNPTFQFVNTSSNATGYTWNFGDGVTSNQSDPFHTYDDPESSYEVVLVASNSAGCTDTARLTVLIREEVLFYIPNSFTPNGDESNNAFEPVFTSGIDATHFLLMVYNRWGEAVFETKDPLIGWDGTYSGILVPTGTYIWTLYFKDPNSDKKYEYRGHVNVLR